jgi:hypothetical protein
VSYSDFILREKTGPYNKINKLVNEECCILNNEMSFIRSKRNEWKEVWIKEQLILRQRIMEKYNEILELYNKLED